MIFDAENLYSNDQQVTATSVSTSHIDHFGEHHAEVAADAAGPQFMPNATLLVQISTSYVVGTSIQVGLYEDDEDDFASEVLVIDGPVVTDLTAGSVLLRAGKLRITERFTRLKYVDAGADLDAVGTVIGGWVDSVQIGVPAGLVA